jgi:hypothetical protein
MQYKELKKILNESLINPNSRTLSPHLKAIIDVNNTAYWVIRAIEELNLVRAGEKGSLKLAITLLLLARARRGEKTRNLATDKDNTLPEG